MKTRIFLGVSFALTLFTAFYLLQKLSDRSPHLLNESTHLENRSPASSSPLKSVSGNTLKNGAVAPSIEPDTGSQISAENRAKWLAVLSGNANGTADGFWGPFPKATAAEVEAFLQRHGHTPMNFLTVYEMNNDTAWLERAFKQFPNSPAVLARYFTAMEGTLPPHERQLLLERWKAADANNPIARVFIASELLKQEDSAQQGLEELKSLLSLPGYYDYTSERIRAHRQFREVLGRSSPEADFLTICGATLHQLAPFNNASKALGKMTQSATANGDNEMAQRLGRMSYELGGMLMTPEAGRTLITNLVGINMQTRALAGFGQTDSLDFLSGTPAQRITELQDQRNRFSASFRAASVETVLEDPILLGGFVKRLENEGEVAAMQWLEQKRKP